MTQRIIKKEFIRNGFTLVELIAIITIIALISSFALISIDKKSSEFNNMSNERMKEIIKNATYSYIINDEEIINLIKSSTSGYEIKLADIIDRKYISDNNLKNIKTRKDINYKNVSIIVKYGLNKDNTSYEYKYEINGID